jgi:hypothetical protein
VGQFEIAELRSGGLKIKVCAVKTTAFRHGAPDLASLGKITHIVSHHYMRVKRMSALLTIAVGIV